MRIKAVCVIALLSMLPVAAQAQSSYSRVESHSSTTTSTKAGTGGSGSESSASDSVTLKFAPKFKERIKNLKEQIDFSLTKGFITADQAAALTTRQGQLAGQEAELAKSGYPKPALDDLEKAITLLNSDLHKASQKGNVDGGASSTGAAAKPAAAPVKSAVTTKTTVKAKTTPTKATVKTTTKTTTKK